MTIDNSYENSTLSRFSKNPDEDPSSSDPFSKEDEQQNQENGSESSSQEADDVVQDSIDTSTKSNESSDSDDRRYDTGSPIATEFLNDVAGVTISKSTAKTYASRLRQYVNFLEDTDILAAEVGDVNEFFKHRVRNGKRKETVSCDRSAIKSIHKWIKIDSNYEADIDYIELDAIDIESFQYPEPIQREPLEKTELELLYRALNRPRDRLMATVTAETGARNSDIVRITLSRLSLEGSDPYIEMTNTKSGGTYKVYISQILATEIKHFINYQRPSCTSHEDSDYLFLSNSGGRLSTSRFRQIIREAAKEADIQDILGKASHCDGEDIAFHRVTPHALRHTFNYMMEKADIPAEQRSRALGQESIDVNRKYYSHDDSGYKQMIQNLHDI